MNAQKEGITWAIVISLALGSAAQAQTTGWNQTDAGPYDYNASGNWVGENINGIWDSSLTLTAAQTVTFDSNLVLTTGLNIGYTGNFDLTFLSDGTAARTITLGGNITVNPVSNRTITFGSTVANDGVNVNLGGDRTLSVAPTTTSTSKTLRFYNTLSGGNITLDGTSSGGVGGAMRLMGTGGNASTSDVTVTRNAFLFFDSSVSGNTGATRAQSLTLNSGALAITANTGANTVEAITGNLVSSGAQGNYNVVTLAATTSSHSQLTAAAFIRSDNAVTLFRGVDLGKNTIASATSGDPNLSFTTDLSPSLVGGGGLAGTTTISILQGAVGGTSITDTGSTFATYTAANGIRPLDLTTEFASTITDGTSTANNVRLTAAGSLAMIDSATTINSLICNPATSAASMDGSGVLTITSGHVLLNTSNANGAPTINVGLNFGSVEGVIGASFNKGAIINGAISGTAGLTIYNFNATSFAAPSTGLTVNNPGHTITGDINVHGRLALGSTSDFLPSGTRTGDVNIRATGAVYTPNKALSINGLNGEGKLSYGGSGSGSNLTLGGNNASGDFSGVISINNSGSGLVKKIGTGTQILGGICSYVGTTTVSNGMLVIDGSIVSATTVQTGATLAGSGSITKAGTAVAVESGGTLAPGSTTSRGTLTVGGNVTFGSSTFHVDAGGAETDRLAVDGTVSATGTITVNTTIMQGNGPWKIMTATGGITANFTTSVSGLDLYKASDDTELWMAKADEGTVVTIR